MLVIEITFVIFLVYNYKKVVMMMKKVQQIMEASLLLFNEKGVNNVSTNHVAAYLNISPGNLYYHFRNKSDIINSIFDQYSEELKTHFQPTGFQSDHAAIERFAQYLNSVFLLMWRYRFFYINMSDLLSSNKELRDKYMIIRANLSTNITRLIEGFIEDGLISLDPLDVYPFIENLKFHCSCWMNYESTLYEYDTFTKKAAYEGLIKFLFNFRLVSTPEARIQIFELEHKYKKELESLDFNSELLIVS